MNKGMCRLEVSSADPGMVFPVPMHLRHLLRRCDNQSAVLAYVLVTVTEIEIDATTFRRTRRFRTRGRLDRKARRESL